MDGAFVIVHHPSNDEAEADTMAAARVAAETLIRDNDWSGSCRVWTGTPPDPTVLFPRPDGVELMAVFNAGVVGSYAIGGWWKYPEAER